MDPRDKKLLELAGWITLDPDHDPLWWKEDYPWFWEEKFPAISETQWMAEQVSDAVIDTWYLTSEARGQLYFGTWYDDDDEHSVYAPKGSTRAEAITAMLYKWLEEQDK